MKEDHLLLIALISVLGFLVLVLDVMPLFAQTLPICLKPSGYLIAPGN